MVNSRASDRGSGAKYVVLLAEAGRRVNQADAGAAVGVTMTAAAESLPRGSGVNDGPLLADAGRRVHQAHAGAAAGVDMASPEGDLPRGSRASVGVRIVGALEGGKNPRVVMYCTQIHTFAYVRTLVPAFDSGCDAASFYLLYYCYFFNYFSSIPRWCAVSSVPVSTRKTLIYRYLIPWYLVHTYVLIRIFYIYFLSGVLFASLVLRSYYSSFIFRFSYTSSPAFPGACSVTTNCILAMS